MRSILIFLFPLIISTRALAADTAICSTTNEVVGVIHLNGPKDNTFSSQKCIEWDIKNDCYLAPGPEDNSNVCECLKVVDELHHYQSWQTTGELSIQEFHIELDFELIKHRNQSELGGTQFGFTNNMNYVANMDNFDKAEDPSKDLTIRLQRKPVGGEYSETVFDIIYCEMK